MMQGVALTGLSAFKSSWACKERLAYATATQTPYLVIYDGKIEQSAKFGQAAHRQSRSAAIDGDLSELWRRQLRSQMAHCPVPFAGLTTPLSLFCFRELAKTHWMSVSLYAEHTPFGTASIRHTLHAPKNILQQFGRRIREGGLWSEIMADMIARSPSRLDSCVTAAIYTPNRLAASIREPLVSWVIAPRVDSTKVS